MATEDARDDGSATRWLGSGSSVLHEYLVDILGGLVPGILLTVGTAVSLVPPLLDVHRSLASALPGSTEPIVHVAGALGRIGSWPSTPLFFACVGVALMTYVAGHIFYRRDPKLPDQASFRLLERQKIVELLLRRRGAGRSGLLARTSRALRGSGYWLLVRLGEPRRLLGDAEGDHSALSDYLTKDLGAPSAERCEFPYPNFLDYLTKRGLDYLRPLVGWNQDTRSKLWVNILKVRLMLHHPQKCRQIVRNEAHIRLASGTWYVAGTLRRLALLGLGLVVAVVLASPRPVGSGWRIDWHLVASTLGQHFWTLLAPLVVLVVAWYLRRKIDGFYHYQRMREVDWVLETAFSAFRGTRTPLSPPFDPLTEQGFDRGGGERAPR